MRLLAKTADVSPKTSRDELQRSTLKCLLLPSKRDKNLLAALKQTRLHRSHIGLPRELWLDQIVWSESEMAKIGEKTVQSIKW